MSFKTGIAAVFGAVGLKSPVSLSDALFDAIDENNAFKVLEIAKLQPSLLTDLPEKGSGLPQTPGAAYIMHALVGKKNVAAEALRDANGIVLTGTDDKGRTFPMYLAKNPPSNEIYAGMFPLLDVRHVSAADNDGNKLLHYAAMRQSEGQGIEITVPFTSKDINLPNKKGETPLMLTAAFGNQHGLLYLTTMKADLHATDNAGLNATMHALIHSNLGNATFLMELGGKVDFNNPAIQTQMNVASYEGDFKFLQALQTSRLAWDADEATRLQVEKIGQQVQEELERKQNTQKVVAVVASGAGSEVVAPERAAFKKKSRNQTPV